MADTVLLTGISGVTQLIANGEVLCALCEGGIYLYDFAITEWVQIGGTYSFLCTDGQNIFGGYSQIVDRYLDQQWYEFLDAGTPTVTGMVAANGVLYVNISNGISINVLPTSSGAPSFITPPSGTIVANQNYMYVCSSSEVVEYANGTWQTDLVAPQGVQFSTTIILTAANQVLVLGSDNNLYGYDSALKTTLPPIAGYDSSSSVQYAFTPLVLVALTTAGSLYYLDPEQETWQVFNANGPQITAIFGGGPMPYGLDNQGNVYVLSPAALSTQSMPRNVDALVPPSELASVPNANYQGWMTYLASQYSTFAGLTLSQMCLPGTHDSGSYDFSFWLDVAVAGTMAQTQRLSIAEQLEAGARFFDVRPASDNFGSLYIFHGAFRTNVPFSLVLQMVSQFAQRNPGEIVILYLNHIDKQDQSLVDQAVANAFLPGQVFPTSSSTGLASITYEQLRTGGWSVILIADSPAQSSPYWPSSLIAELGTWADTADVPTLLTFINTYLPQFNKPTSPWMLQCQLTPGFWQGVTCASLRLSPLASLGYPGPGPISMASDSKAQVQARLDPQQHQDSAQNLNLFIVDDYDTSWTDLAYTINLGRV